MGNITDRKALDFALEKTAGMMNDFVGGLDGPGVQKVNNVAGTATKGLLVGWVLKSAIQKMMNSHADKAMVEGLMLTDPILKQADPEKVKEFYATICYLAPKLKSDKNIVRELLQNFVKFNRIDLPSIKALADTQGSLSKGEVDVMGNAIKILS